MSNDKKRVWWWDDETLIELTEDEARERGFRYEDLVGFGRDEERIGRYLVRQQERIERLERMLGVS